MRGNRLLLNASTFYQITWRHIAKDSSLYNYNVWNRAKLLAILPHIFELLPCQLRRILNGFLKYTSSFPILISSSHMHLYCTKQSRPTKVNYRQGAELSTSTGHNTNGYDKWKFNATGSNNVSKVNGYGPYDRGRSPGWGKFLVFQNIQSFIRWHRGLYLQQ